VLTTSDKGYILTGPGQPSAEESTHATCSENHYSHMYSITDLLMVGPTVDSFRRLESVFRCWRRVLLFDDHRAIWNCLAGVSVTGFSYWSLLQVGAQIPRAFVT
jgi:hypothetical protein